MESKRARQRLVRLMFVFGFATCVHAVRVVDKESHTGASSSVVSDDLYMEIDWRDMVCLRACLCFSICSCVLIGESVA